MEQTHLWDRATYEIRTEERTLTIARLYWSEASIDDAIAALATPPNDGGK